MASKREIADLEDKIQRRDNEIEYQRNRVVAARGQRNELSDFLCHLLELDPSLDRYRKETIGEYGHPTRGWDFQGVKAAVEHRRAEAIADKYAPKVAEAAAFLSFSFVPTAYGRDCE